MRAYGCIVDQCEGRERLFGLAERVRDSTDALIASLDGVDQATALTDKRAREKETAAAVKEAEKVRTNQHLASIEAALAATLDENDALNQRYGSQAWAIHRLVSEVAGAWPHTGASVAAVTAAASRSRNTANELALACACLTIPLALEQRLRRKRVGAFLDFHREFAGELADAKQRTELLESLSEEEIGGVVDADRGLVYRLSSNAFYRAFTYVSPLLFALGSAALLVGIGNLDNLGVDIGDNLHLNNVGQLIAAYLLVLAGVVLHLLVENVKQDQLGTAPVLAISDGLNWLHLRWAGLAWTVFLPMLVIVIGLRVLGIGSDSSDLPLYVFAGFSFDSVVGLILTRFNNSSATGVKKLTARIAGDGDSVQ